MINVSEQYKQLVYSTEYARHFVPRILLKIIDLAGSEATHYSAAPFTMSDLNQLCDGIYEAEQQFYTMELNSNTLDGTVRLVPEDDTGYGQQGLIFSTVSDENGEFTNGVTVLTTAYPAQLSTVGHTLYFNNRYDSVPKDFDIVYYRSNIEIARSEVRDNKNYICAAFNSVKRYDKVEVKVYSTTLPYRRVRIIEDVPGVHFFFDEFSVISFVLTQRVDVFSEELETGEIDIEVKNNDGSLSVFSDFIKRKQPIDVAVDMVFPDGSHEQIKVGSFFLYSSKANIGALSFSFVARNILDKLSQSEYIKGALPASTVSLYDLAEAVLQDAGITDYQIDTELLNIYTTAFLPIAPHKELLRIIAQASQSIVVPTADGSVHIKYFSPLVLASNLISNPNFDSDFTNWNNSGATLNTSQILAGKQSVFLAENTYIEQSLDLEEGHVYYISCYVIPEDVLSSGTSGIYIASVLASINFASLGLQSIQWSRVTALYTATMTGATVFKLFNESSESFMLDAVQCIDLTALYGTAPDQEWCDNSLRFFSGSALVPRFTDPVPIDTFDLSILEEYPEIKTLDPVKAIDATIYSYKTASEPSEIYKVIRDVLGTEEFIIKFSQAAVNCTVQVVSVDEYGTPTAINTASIISSTFYAQAASLKITANTSVQITVTGNKISIEETVYRLSNTSYDSTAPDADIRQINNKLVVNREAAEDVSSYALYWYNKNLEYAFNWRQNPAVENLDTAVVYDALSRNNPVLLTEQELCYVDGIIAGSRKGIG